MRIGQLALAVALAAVLAACSEPRLDATTSESMQASAEKVRASLPSEKQAEFMDAVTVLMFSHLDLGSMLKDGPGNVESKMRQVLHGKTADEVIAEAKRVQAEREAEERAQALEEIRELEEKRQAARQAEEALKQFEVTRSRFYVREDVNVG